MNQNESLKIYFIKIFLKNDMLQVKAFESVLRGHFP